MSLNLNNMWQGWRNALNKENLNPQLVEAANLRLDKCAVCPHKKERYFQSIIETVVNGLLNKKVTRGEFRGFSCGLCGCLLEKKAYSPAEWCPAGVDKNNVRSEVNEGTHGMKQQWGPMVFDKNNIMTDNGIR